MTYEERLVMPSSYAVMSKDEMTYLTGGWNYQYSRNNIRVPIKKQYLSKTVCLLFGEHVVAKKGNGIKCNNMFSGRIAVELYAHAMAYYSVKTLKKAGIKAQWINDMRSCARVADIGLGDGLDLAYELIWALT